MHTRLFVSMGVLALFVLIGFGCNSDTSSEGVSSDSIFGSSDDVVESTAGKPAAREKEKSTESPLAELSQSAALLVTTEMGETANLHLHSFDTERDSLVEGVSLSPNPVSSPDGAVLSYLFERDERLDVGLIDRKSREIKQVDDAVYSGDDVEVVWNEASTRYVTRRTNELQSDSHVLLFHFDGTGEQRLVEDDALLSDVAPLFSPDGERLAYRRVSAELAALQDPSRVSEGSLNIYSLETGAATLLLERVWAFEWIDADHVIVLRTPDPRTGRSPIERVSVHGGEPEQLVSDASSFVMRPDRSAFAYVSGDIRTGFDILLFAFEDGIALDTVSRFGGVDFSQEPTELAFSENGERLSGLLVPRTSFSVTRKPGSVLFVDFEENLARTLSEGAFHPMISPDGQHVAYETDEESDAAVESGLEAFSTVWTRDVSGSEDSVRVTTDEDATSHHWGWVRR